MKLYENPFSPFARKVRIVMELKGLSFETLDGLVRPNREALEAVNGRVEVPTLVDGDVVVVNSADIVAYLDHTYDAFPVLPADPARRVAARAWERSSDSLVDAICTNISYWLWAKRGDVMPDGMLEIAQREMGVVYDAMERDLGDCDYLCGDLSIADIALFPHIAAGRMLNVPFDTEKHPRTAGWLKRLRAHPVFAADLERGRLYVQTAIQGGVDIEREKIFWRGDRIEWVLSRGFWGWFHNEIVEERVLWPGLPIA